jgi:hypothetical protein
MTAQLFLSLYADWECIIPRGDHLLIELYILCYAKLITALVSLLSIHCNFNSQTEASHPSRLYRTTR